MNELDKEVAEKVMGWTDFWEYSLGVPPMHIGKGRRYAIPMYSEVMVSTWDVVKRLIDPDGPFSEQKWSFGLGCPSDAGYEAAFRSASWHKYEIDREYPIFTATDRSAPTAICLAALAAVDSLKSPTSK